MLTFSRTADIDGLDVVAPREHLRAVQTVVYIHERARLMPVAPDLQLVLSAQFCGDDFAAHRGGSFFATAIIRAVGAIDVVVAGHTSLDAEVLHVVEPLIPLVKGLDVHRTDGFHALAAKVGNEVSADETTGTAHKNFVHGL